MKRSITYASLFGSVIIFCLATNFIETLFMFLLFGFIPGRSEPFSAQEMLAFYTSVLALIAITSLHKRLTDFTQLSQPSTS